jgi:hypothetical protein
MDAPAYRIEHRRDAAALILGFRDGARYPQIVLAPDAHRLTDDDETGEVVLIDQATEEIVATRHLVQFS